MSVDFRDVCAAGGGASGISVDGLPPLPDPEALDTHARALAASGDAVHSGVNDAARSWAGLSGAYEAPEAGQVLAGFGPVVSRSQDLAALTGKAAAVLGAYADRARELKQRITALRADIVALDGLIGGNDDWQSHLNIVDRHRETMDKASALAQAILDSDAACATELSALTGGERYNAPAIPRATLDGSTDLIANGLTHAQHFFGTDQDLPDLPWGPPNVSLRLGGPGSAGQGFVSALISAGQGLHTLLGTTDKVKQTQAWQGMFALGAAAVTTKAVIDRGFRDTTAEDLDAVLTVGGALKETIHYDDWATDPWHAAGATGFDVAALLAGGTGAGIKAGSTAGKLGAETAALSKAATGLTGAARTALSETTAAVTAKLAQARTAIWNDGIGNALDKLDTGLTKLNQTLNGHSSQPAAAEIFKSAPGAGLASESARTLPAAAEEAAARVQEVGTPEVPPGIGSADVGPSPREQNDTADPSLIGRNEDQHVYGEPRESHGQHPPYPELFRKNRDSMALVSEPNVPWGRDGEGHGTQLAKDGYDARFTEYVEDGKPVRHAYPPNDGAVPGNVERYRDIQAFTQKYGTQLDRIGRESGSFLGVLEEGRPATFEARSLPVATLADKYFQYRIAEVWPPGTDRWTIEIARVAPAFGRKGGALQIVVRDELGKSVRVHKLLIMGVLKK